MKTKTFYLYFIFFPAGLAVLANAQRYPELRNQLHLTNGEFGTYLSFAGLGAVLAFITGSRIIHAFGIGKSLLLGFIGLYSSVAIFPHCHRALSFLLINLFFGFSSTLNHINMNAQGIHNQNRSGKLILPFLAGMWSSGAVAAALISVLVSKYFTLCWQIDLIATFKFAPALSFGHILIVQSEFSAADWSAIYARNTIGVSISEAAYCYLVFIITMGLSRIYGSRVNRKYSEETIIRWIPRIGSIGFGLCLIVSTFLAHNNRQLAFLISLFAFAFLGIGNSFIVLLLFGIASRKSDLMPGAVIAAMGLVGAILSFIVKFVIAWIAQATNLTIALMIPTIMLFAGSVLSRYGDKEPKLN
jgi:MFS family permease